MPLFFAAETNSKAIQYFRSVPLFQLYGIKQNTSKNMLIAAAISIKNIFILTAGRSFFASPI
jgi:hypothetical protein